MDFLETVGVLDLVFSVILLISVLLGIMRGAIREILSLVGLALAVYLALNYAETVSTQYVSRFFEQPRISYLVTFALIIIGTIFSTALINMFISQLLRASGLSFLNRILGVVFGAIRGVVICSIIVMVLSFIPSVKEKSWWKASAMAPTFQQITKMASKYLPKDVSDYIDNTKTQVQQKVNQVVTTKTQGSQQGQSVDALSQKLTDIEKTEKVLEAFAESNRAKQQMLIELESANGNGQSETTNDQQNNANGSQSSETKTNKSTLTLESYQ